jgi:hypothetical protein
MGQIRTILYFYKDAKMKETDFVPKKNATLYSTEIKKTTSTTSNDCINIKIAEKLKNRWQKSRHLLCHEMFPISKSSAIAAPILEI